MPVQVSYPGVYIDEQLSGAHAITPVSTSVTAFIGMARRGRLGTPTRVTNLGQFQTLYGNDASMGELVPQVGQFFLNGGSTAWIMRIADANAHPAAVTLNNEAGQPALRLTANDAVEDGNLIRAEVDYDTANPESTFNLRLYRRLVGPTGTVTQDGLETFTDLSMNPASGRFVETVVNSASLLVTAQSVAAIANVPGFSISGLMFPPADADVFTAIEQRFGTNPANTRSILISVDGQPAIPVTFAQGPDLPGFINNMQTAINTALPSQGMTGTVAVEVTPVADGIRQLRVTSGGGSVASSSARSPLRSRTIQNRPARRTTASRPACRAYGLRSCRASRDPMPASIRCSAAPVRRISVPEESCSIPPHRGLTTFAPIRSAEP